MRYTKVIGLTILLGFGYIFNIYADVDTPAVDGRHNDHINGGHHSQDVAIPRIDFASGLTGYYKVVRVFDGDTITIETPKGTRPNLRLVGIDTPEINAKRQIEKNRAIAARDYLRSLILNKHVYVTFEKSDTTLDGIARGRFCRPLAYIFLKTAERNIFVNLEIVWRDHGVKYFKYDFEYEDFFRLDETTAQKRINRLDLSTPNPKSAQKK